MIFLSVFLGHEESSGYGVGLWNGGPDASKDPLSACGIRVHKICSSVRLMVKLKIFHWKKILSPSETNQRCGGEDGWYCHLSTKAEILPFYIGLTFQETSPFALKPITMQYRAWPPRWHKTTTTKNRPLPVSLKVIALVCA